MSGSHLSRDFFELVKAIGESKSKQVRAIREQLEYMIRKSGRIRAGAAPTWAPIQTGRDLKPSHTAVN